MAKQKSVVKIRLNTWNRCGNRESKFKRGLAPREAFVDYNKTNNTFILKDGAKKWKTWDITVSRKADKEYIQERKKLYSGLCFENRQQAQTFMERHKEELDKMAASNPLFDHWSIINVIKRFDPTHKVIYGKDIKE